MEIVVLIVILIAVALLAMFFVRIYNKLVQRRLRVDEGWSQIDVQLKRRHDLIPNLVAAVRGYMEFEEETLMRVTEARASAVAAGAEGLAETAAAENQLTQTLRSLFAVVENYPDLKANQNVMSLQEELTTTENKISFSRQHYNSVVLEYNTDIAQVPAVMIAGTFGFSAREFFEAEPEAQEVPEVRLR
jgi:LemA protein